jgi:spermidine synthase
MEGRREEAVAMLRAAVRRNFAQPGLFETAARAISESSTDPAQAREAVHWARRACQATRFRDPAAMETLAAAHAAARQYREAVDTARQARELALTQGNAPLAARLGGQLQEYEHAAGGSGAE